jgi:probable DNA repair protein
MTSPILLCATTRLAQTLRTVPAADGAIVWDTPQAFALEAWLDAIGEEAMLSGALPASILLDALSEKMLWQQVIKDSISLDHAPLFDVAAMAAKAADAYAIATIWALETGQDAMSREVELFAQWRTAFRSRLQENGWTVVVDRRDAVLHVLEQGTLKVQSRVAFVGFDTLNPLERRLATVLDAEMLSHAAADVEEGPCAIATFEDVGAECHAAARWAETQLATNPSWRLGIVVPDLNGVRDRLEYELEHALHPELAVPACAEHPRRYNFSLGRTLAEVPVVACALHLLGLVGAVDAVEQPALSCLLLNAYWSDSGQESDARALVDANMRKRLKRRVNVAQLVELAQQGGNRTASRCPAAVRHLSQLSRHAGNYVGVAHLPSAWASIVRTILLDVGWAGSAGPGCRALSSHEYQAREAWSELLDRFASADRLIGEVGFLQVVTHLRTLCGERVFQPQTRGNPSVHVVGMLESTGLQFDALWVMGMHDGAWPPAPSPNPLLSVVLQRAHRITNSCAAVQLDYARTVLRRLRRQAPRVHFSCALMDGSQELRHSPLFELGTDKPGSSSTATVPTPPWSEVLECFEDAVGPVLGENERVRGGVSLLRAQALCPAWAFYRYRLGAAALERPQEGLGAQERGTLVHDALESFWNQVDGKQALVDLAARPGTLDERISLAISASLESYESCMGPLPAASRELEVLRLHRILHEWLELEMRRADFVVVECEREIKHRIGRVALTLRIDRIDRQDGKLVVIDYKTGVPPGIRSWAAVRIVEPQLPIYALALSGAASDEQIGALIFGKVGLGDAGFTGLSATDKFVGNVRGMHQVVGKRFVAFPNWNTLQAHWGTRIAAVADEFARGEAAVDLDDTAGLEYCEVLPLLRLPEREACRAGMFKPPADHDIDLSRQEF